MVEFEFWGKILSSALYTLDQQLCLNNVTLFHPNIISYNKFITLGVVVMSFFFYVIRICPFITVRLKVAWLIIFLITFLKV